MLAENDKDFVHAPQGAIKRVVLSYRPPKITKSDALINAIREAKLLGRPHVSEICSPTKDHVAGSPIQSQTRFCP